MNLTEALAILAPNIMAHLTLYRVGRADESTVLPQALFTSPDELRALACVIEAAKPKMPSQVKLTNAGLARVLDGVPGMIFMVDHYTDCVVPFPETPGHNAHVRDYRYKSPSANYQIWSLGPNDYEFI